MFLGGERAYCMAVRPFLTDIEWTAENPGTGRKDTALDQTDWGEHPVHPFPPFPGGGYFVCPFNGLCGRFPGEAGQTEPTLRKPRLSALLLRFFFRASSVCPGFSSSWFLLWLACPGFLSLHRPICKVSIPSDHELPNGRCCDRPTFRSSIDRDRQ
jgi:hypothetical protein